MKTKAIIRISSALLLDALKLPPDLRICGAEYDAFAEHLDILVAGPGLPNCPVGQRPEIFTPAYHETTRVELDTLEWAECLRQSDHRKYWDTAGPGACAESDDGR